MASTVTGDCPSLVRLELVENTVRSFQPTKVFRDLTGRTKCFEFSPAGTHIVSCNDGDQIVVYDSTLGVPTSTLYSKKYGVDLVRFAGNTDTIVHGSTKVDDTIRYLSLHDNKYIRYFIGHSNKVVSLSVAHETDIFLSASLDRSVKLWDLRSPNCQGHISVMGNPVAAITPDSNVLAVGVNSETLQLFDIRTFDKGPFLSVNIPQERKCDWTDLKFSPEDNWLLIPTNGALIHLINSYNGDLIHTYTNQFNDIGISTEASFSPDSQFLFSGSTGGRIQVWNIMATASKGFCTLQSAEYHPGVVGCVKFNPKYMMMATACTNMVFWVPAYNSE